MLISVIATVVSLAASWIIFKKMGRQGWEGIIPCYNTYVVCEELYGNGWKFLLMLIPFYNIYFMFKMYIDWAHAFNKSTGFGVGMVFLPFIFQLILALDEKIVYRDGSKANTESDVVSRAVEKTREVAGNVTAPKEKVDENAIEKIAKLAEMKDKGIITQEEFDQKKAELLTKI